MNKKIINNIAKKSILLKPIFFPLAYRTFKKKNFIKKGINKFTANMPMTKKELKYLKRDMAYCMNFYNITTSEYFLYGFRYKNHFERKKFLGNPYRQNYLYLLGEKEGQETLRDKYKTYKILKKYYKRDIIQLNTKEDYTTFENYVKKHPIFVKKPVNLSFGKGISLVNSKDYKSIKELFKEIIEEAPVIIEEQIISDDTIASLHPESVNTIRIVTYRDKYNNVSIHAPFIKIGRGKSFVDNGGAGGLLALIDEKTGIITTDAKDEMNIVYTKHPDTGITIKGFKIPKWNEMINLAKEAALAFDKTRYIGWDVALSKNKGPVIIEGNGKTQFYGQQMLDEIGKKESLEKLINYKQLKKESKNIERWELKPPKRTNGDDKK